MFREGRRHFNTFALDFQPWLEQILTHVNRNRSDFALKVVAWPGHTEHISVF